MLGTEIIPSIIGVAESGTHMRRSIMRESIEMKGEVGLHKKGSGAELILGYTRKSE